MRKIKNSLCFWRISSILAVVLIGLTMPVFAQSVASDKSSQEKTPIIAETKSETPPSAESEKTAEKTIEADLKIETNRAVKTNSAVETNQVFEPAFARNFSTRTSFDVPKVRDFSFTKKTENVAPEAQQSGDKDDTMMGVMGKGTDGVKLGGHVGFVVPIVGRGNGVTTNLGDRFVFGFPVGLTLKTKKNIAVDFEFIPTFNTGRDFVLTIHPGIIYGFAKKYAVGVRAAYDAGAGSFGFTPLISRGFKINDKLGWFIEADFPIRSNYNPYRDRFGSIAFAAHAGIAF